MAKREENQKFIELPHTADVSIRVFGEKLATLFIHAAEGMYYMMGVKIDDLGDKHCESIALSENDAESLLVSFLTELIFFIENGIAFNKFNIEVNNLVLIGEMIGNSVISYDTQIKAVTFNELIIKKEVSTYCTDIVFDV